MYDHFIAFDWAQHNVAVARMTAKADNVHVFQSLADPKELRIYLDSLTGSKKLAIEESNTSQWLFTEFRSSVDELVICDPRRNRLLLEGPKSDPIDAQKLVKLLKADLLKPVYHCSDNFIYLRKMVSGYDDLVMAGVRLQNQRSALFRACGLLKSELVLTNTSDNFVLEGLDRSIAIYKEEKIRYEKEFDRLRNQNKLIGNLSTIPGIGPIHAVKLAAIIVSAHRFPTRNHFLSYCGLIKLERMSGGKSYGKKNPQFNRAMKNIFKTAAISVIKETSDNHFNSFYKHLVTKKNCAAYNARHAVARRIAAITLGVFKTGRKYDKKRLINDLIKK